MIMRRREGYAGGKLINFGDKVEKRMRRYHDLVKYKMGKKLRKMKKNLEKVD